LADLADEIRFFVKEVRLQKKHDYSITWY